MRGVNPGPLVAIACGGTGGHLFPGLAIGGEILARGGRVMLLVSNKDIDQRIASSLAGFDVVSLPAVGLVRGGLLRFGAALVKSLSLCRRTFREKKPVAVLAMGGFTSAPPILAAKQLGIRTYLHEANTIPGRANRWLAHFVNEAFVFFNEASGSLNLQRIEVVGMPVREQFTPVDPCSPRMALGLDAARPTVLVMGGSQGASGINDLMCAALPSLLARLPNLQFIHLTGEKDVEKVASIYRNFNCRGLVRPFLTEMELALGAATVTVSRSGASSLAEQAAMRVPAVLIPYPTAADNHQFYNAESFVACGAALMLEQRKASGEILARMLGDLLLDDERLGRMSAAMGARHLPGAAERVADRILASIPGVRPSHSSLVQPDREEPVGLRSQHEHSA